MTDLFKLGPFEEFELWLNGLLAHHKHTGLPFGDKKPLALNRDFREDVRTTVQVVQDLITKGHQIVEAEIEDIRGGDPSFHFNPNQDFKRQIRDYRRQARRIDEFLNFLDFLDKYNVLGLSVIRLPEISRREFKAFGFMLTEQIGRLRKSEAHIYLKKKFFDWKFQHVIQRDIVSAMEMEGIREQLELLFLEFFHLLSTTKYIQQEMRRSFKFRKFIILFVDRYFACKRFLKLMGETQTYLDHYQPELSSSLHAISSALRMETRKVFGRELRNIESRQKIDEIYTHMENACGLLQNAFQDSFIHLVHLVKPTFNEFELFEDLASRYQESVTLLNDLQRIYQMVRDVGNAQDEQRWAEFHKILQPFQDTSMKFLMFKDWQSCEEFIDELNAAALKDRTFLLHRFEIYLSTLIGEVQKRAVFGKFDPNLSQQTTRH